MQIAPKVGKAREVDAKLVMACPQVRETPVINHRPQGRHRRIDSWLEFQIDQFSNRLPPPRRSNRDNRSLRLMWLDQDEHGVGQQDLPYSLEGMDHARDCDSSKRPAEECNLEWFATRAETFG
jgi:hypothetical protein